MFGELVYDNASSKPCRTGFLCGRAEVDRGVIDSLALEAADGAIDESTVVTRRYPYVDGRWIAADDATSSGATVQARLVDLCNAAIPHADESRPAAGYTVQGTANAASSGGEEACQAQPNGLLPAGLVEGAPVTIRDASSGEVIGTGTVSSTTFVQLADESTAGARRRGHARSTSPPRCRAHPSRSRYKSASWRRWDPPASEAAAASACRYRTTRVERNFSLPSTRPPSTRPPSTRPPSTRPTTTRAHIRRVVGLQHAARQGLPLTRVSGRPTMLQMSRVGSPSSLHR